MATRYVNTASTAGGNGTTNATSGADRAYASLAEFEATLSGTLTEVWTVYCSGTTADTTAVTFAGFTPDASNYVEVIGDNDTGAWSVDHHRLVATAAFGPVLRVQVPYCRLGRLQVQNTSDTSSAFAVRSEPGTATDLTRWVDCIARGIRGGFIAISGQHRFVNCLSYGSTSGAGFHHDWGTGSGVTCHWLHCVAYGNNNGFTFNSTFSTTRLAQNCYAGSNGTADVALSGAGITVTTCASSDATGSSGLQSLAAADQFTDPAAGDFSLLSTADLIAAGTYTSAAPIDILGTTRPDPPSIGAWERAATGGGGLAIPVILRQFRARWGG